MLLAPGLASSVGGRDQRVQPATHNTHTGTKDDDRTGQQPGKLLNSSSSRTGRFVSSPPRSRDHGANMCLAEEVLDPGALLAFPKPAPGRTAASLPPPPEPPQEGDAPQRPWERGAAGARRRAVPTRDSPAPAPLPARARPPC